MLTIALVASVCGAENRVDFTEFAEDRVTLLREFPPLANGLPSHDTFNRVFRPLDPDAFCARFGGLWPQRRRSGGVAIRLAQGQDAAKLFRPGGAAAARILEARRRPW